MGELNEDHYVHLHTNKLAVVGLAPHHAIIQEQWTPTEIEFNANRNGKSLLENKVSGKRKKGATWLAATDAICHITCQKEKEEKVFTIRRCVDLMLERGCSRLKAGSCIGASLLELNENLLSKPELVLNDVRANRQRREALMMCYSRSTKDSLPFCNHVFMKLEIYKRHCCRRKSTKN